MQTIILQKGSTRVAVVPERGAIVSALEVDGRSILYMDDATLADPTKNVRGGVPVLFPFAGRLVDDRFVAAGTTIKQHGFGRNRAWEVLGVGPSRLALRLDADDATRAVFPYELSAELRVEALADGVAIALATTNTGPVPLPLAPGWHPYFALAHADKARFACDVPGLEAGVIDDAKEYDFGVAAPDDGVSRLTSLGLVLEADPSMRHLQVWTLPGRDFVCVEPFWGPADAINTDARAVVAPGETLALWLSIRVAPGNGRSRPPHGRDRDPAQ